MRKLTQYVKGFYMALGMFCGIPLPFHVWDEKLTTIMVASLPPVGALIGAIWWGAALLLTMPTLPIVMVAAILTVVPFWVAGFIHLDGYMDTSDALLSWRSLPKRLEILKDPNVGAFAVVMLAILFLLQFAAMFSVVSSGRYFILLITICVVSRSCSAFSILALRHMPISNYGALLGTGGNRMNKAAILFVGIVAIVLSVFYAGFIGLIVPLAVVAGYVFAMRKVYKVFNGVSGDLLGYSMVIGELTGLIALALLQGVEINLWF